MRYAKMRSEAGSEHVVVDDDGDMRVLATDDLASVLTAARSGGVDRLPTVEAVPSSFAAPVGDGTRCFIAGYNYPGHAGELRREQPTEPRIGIKLNSALVGATDEVWVADEVAQLDWEVELAVVVGAPLHRATEDEVDAAIAGYTVANDVTARDWQGRSPMQAKSFQHTSPVGPWIVPADEAPPFDELELICEVDELVMQHGPARDMIYRPAALLAHISRFTTVLPGDVLLTGSPTGSGASRTPPSFLAPGNRIRSIIPGIGMCDNACIPDPTA